ncbi:MAG: hypothetical protein M1839_000653 [Geoglossum umbratile]|nr:MAG: hypothetical protein M1839_000653 [Geoglossum umbratile]
MSTKSLSSDEASHTDVIASPSKAGLRALRDAIFASQTPITCGGAIPISTQPSSSPGFGTEPVTSPPVVIRWSSSDEGTAEDGHAIQFPVVAGDRLEKLCQDCEPATFGFGGKDVLDESYRKAAKMDNTRFCTNFHPHDHGIIDAISQALLPAVKPIKSEDNISTEHLGVTAELYKLNIYSGESGKFKAHVDTPRGATQFGSLVVCLPYPHEGGQLAVRHQGLETIYDWSNTGTNEITWAAFYSDCEHEVFEVKSGHRITLTYNLFISKRVGNIIGPSPVVDPAKYPAYDLAKALLLNPEFMKDGGVIGIYCSHKYAHTTSDAGLRLPFALKGSDLTVYSIFRALGVPVKSRPIIDLTYLCDSDDEDCDIVGKDYHDLVITHGELEGKSLDQLRPIWPYESIAGIHWLNNPSTSEMAWMWMVCGNEQSIDWTYSSAAILVEVPDFAKRSSTITQD